MREFFTQTQIFHGKLTQKVPENPAVVRAGGRADVQDAADVQKQNGDGDLRDDADRESGTGRAGIRGGKRLSRPRFGENVAVPPNVLLNHQNASRQHQPHRVRRIAGAQHKGSLREVLFSGVQAGQHGGKLLLGNARKERRRQ